MEKATFLWEAFHEKSGIPFDMILHFELHYECSGIMSDIFALPILVFGIRRVPPRV